MPCLKNRPFVKMFGEFIDEPSSTNSERFVNDSDTQTPVMINQILSAPKKDNYKMFVNGKFQNNFTIIGIVLSINLGDTIKEFIVTDGTGFLNLKYYCDNEDVSISEHTYIWAGGRINAGNPKTMIVFNIQPILDHNFIAYHTMSSVFVHLKETRGLRPNSIFNPLTKYFSTNKYHEENANAQRETLQKLRDVEEYPERNIDRSEIKTLPVLATTSYHKYDKNEIKPILKYLSNETLSYTQLVPVSKRTKVPLETLRSWYNNIKANDRWFPYCEGRPNKRIFTKEGEDAILANIKDMINKGYPVTYNTIKSVAHNYFVNHSEHCNKKEFSISDKWVHGFKKRNNLVCRAPHPEKRTVIKEDIVTYFLNSLRTCMFNYPPNRIINIDETAWKLYESPKLVIVEKGIKTINLNIDVSSKISITAIGGITASGEKLQLWVIAKGKTDVSLRKFGDRKNIVFNYTTSGWVTETIVLKYLDWLSDLYKNEPIVLVLDVYPAHRTEAVREKAKSRNIILLFVPAGGTSLYQPLDIKIFGELKSRARKQFNQISNLMHMETRSFSGTSYEKAVKILGKCWDDIPSINIVKAFKAIKDI